MQPEISLPNDPQFWDYLFSTADKEEWNLIVYEQDSISVEMYGLVGLQVVLYCMQLCHYIPVLMMFIN